VAHVLFGEAEIGAVDIEVGAVGAEYFSAESAVVFAPVDAEELSAALALIGLGVLPPALAGTEPGLQLLPELLLHHLSAQSDSIYHNLLS
jgi:hypothetical protein